MSDNDVSVSSQTEEEAQKSDAESDAAPAKRELTDADRAKLTELSAVIEKFTAQKRWSDVIKATLQKADIVVGVEDKVALFAEAGRMYLERSSNQAEAIKCFQRVLDIDRGNVEAITHLKEMYEKRRDWEHLVEVMRAECDLLGADEQPARRLELAKLANEKLRKPNVCIDLWREVLGADPENAEALAALSGLYERAREWAPLAEVLEKQSELAGGGAEAIAILQKLGSVYSEKLQDDAGALRAYKRLLDFDPNDRRAQEQLKKRWVATGAWDELEAFYATTDKVDELIRTLERAADTTTTELAARISLQFRIARLWQDKKGAADRAARALEKVLVLDANNHEAAEALSPIYERAGDAKKLASVFEVRLKHVTDSEPRVVLLREAGLLYEEKLKNPQTAFDRFREAFVLDPKQDVLREDLERVAAKVNGWDQVCAAYEAAIDGATHPDDANDLRLAYGRSLTALGRMEDAIQQFRAVYDDRSDDERAITALEALYRQAGDYRQLLGVLQRRAELESDVATRKRLAYDVARLWQENLGDAERAIEAYRNIPTEFGEGETDAYRALDDLYAKQGSWADLAQTLEHRIDIGPSSEEELAALKFRLASTLHQHLGDKQRAIDLYREVLTLVPEHEGALAALESLLVDAELGGQAAAILTELYEARADFAKLVTALEVLVEFTSDPEQRIDLITKSGEVRAEQLRDLAGAFAAYARAFDEAPDKPGIVERFEGLAKQQAKLADMVRIVQARCAKLDDPALARTLLIRAAQLHENDLGDVDAAVAAYSQALARDEGDEEILGALEALYRRTERWRDLIDVLRKRVAITGDPGGQEQLLAQIAFIHDEMLSEPEAAIRVYAEILELDPTSRTALAALDSLYERQAMWSELADNVSRQLSLAEDDAAQIALMVRLGLLRETRMNAAEAAIEIYREVLERDAGNAEALAALERLLVQSAHQVQIAEVLEPLYRDRGEYAKLIGIHDVQVRHSGSSDQRVALLHRIAELYEVALEDLPNAFQSFARALAEDPGNSETRAQLDRIAATSDAWQALAEVYERQAAAVQDPAALVSLHTKAAQIRQDQLADVDGAIAHYRRVLELDESNLEAASALETLYQSSARYEDLARILLTKTSLVGEPQDQKAHLFRAGAIYEDVLEQPQAAIDVYQRVLQIEADDLAALDKLIALHLKLSQWQAVLEVYAQKADVVSDPEEKKALYVQIGVVYEERLGQPEKAIETYQRVLELDPDDVTALARLDALYAAGGRAEELLSVLERQAELAGDPAQALDFRYRIGELYEQQLADPFRAVEVYREVLDVAPDHGAAIAALERMIAAGQEPPAAAAVLEPIYRAAVDSPRLAHVLEVLITHEQDPVRKVDLLQQVAEIYEVHLDQPEQAFDAFARAFPHDIQHETTLAALDRLAERLPAWPALAALYDREIARLREESPQVAIELALRLAQLFETQIGDVDAAIARYRIVFETDATHVQALMALDRLYEATERWAELATILERELDVAGSPDEMLAMHYRLGQLQEHRLGNIDKAIERYREILAAAPEHEPARVALEGLFARGVAPIAIGEILEPLYRMQEAWDRLVGVYEAQLRSIADPEERRVMIQRIAEIAEERAGNPGLAFMWMQRALLEDPSGEHAAAEVERLAPLSDGWSLLADTYATILESESTSEEGKLAIGKRLSRVYEEELGDVARAEETYRYVVAFADRDEDVLLALDRIYTDHGAGEALSQVLRKRIAATSDERDKVELSYRLGQVLWNECRRTDEAIEVYRGLLDKLDARHEDTLHALQNIYTVTAAWPQLFEIYEKELDVVVGDSAQAEILGRMAILAATRLGNYERAVELLRRVLDLLGEDPEALNALGNIYAAQENWTDLVDVLEREVAVCSEDALRIAIYGDLGRIWYERLHRDRNALESWERVLDLDPGNTNALFAIAAIHRAAGAHNDLVDTLHRVVDVGAATLADAAIEGAYMELGALYSQQLKQPIDAVQSYTKALECNPRNFGALDALEAIHVAQEQWEECIEVKQRRVTALEDGREQIAVLLDIANMWGEKLEQPDSATGPLNQIVEIDPLHGIAFERLEELHRDAARFEDLIALYLARVEASPEPAARIQLLRNVARVYEKDLDDKNQTFDALLIAWTQDFTNEESAREIERLAGLTQRWNELLTTANQSLAEVSDDVAVKNAICLKCARWYGKEGHPEYAIPYLQQVLAVDPINRPAMRQMAELYRQTQQWQIYAQALGKLVEMTEDPSERADVFVSMGELHEENFKLPEQAIKHYREALDAVPGHVGAIKALERMFRAREQWFDLIDILRRKVDAVRDPEQVLAAKLELAEAYEDRVADKTKAIEHYRKVLEDDERNLLALKGLERLYAQHEQWQSLLEVLEKQLEIVQNEREQIALLVRIAGMWEEEFLKVDKAAERLERVVELDPTHTEALTGLARIYRQQRKWQELIATRERHVDAAAEKAEKVELFLDIGTVYRDELSDTDRAIESFLNVTSVDGAHPKALRGLADLYEKREEHSMALDAMEKLNDVVDDPGEKVALLFRMGGLLDKQLGDRVSALDHFQRAVDIDGGHLPSLEAMRAIHMDAGDYNAAARTLERICDVDAGPRRGAAFRVELGRLYDAQLEEHERAIECFEAAYKLDPDNSDAALPLVDEYTRAERWKDAEPLLQMLVRTSGAREIEQQHRLWLLYGQCASTLGDDETAVKAFARALELDAQDLQALTGLAAAHYRRSEWDNAFKYYQMVLVHHRDELGSELTTDTFYRLGIVKREQGERKKALNMFEKALEENALHRPTLEALVQLYTDDKDYEQVIQHKKRILEAVDDASERFAMIEEIGDLWNEQLKNPAKAIELYVDASELQPKSHKILHKLLGLYQSTAQWEPAIGIIDRVAELDPRGEAKAKYAYTVGVIYRDELKDGARALERFSQALDLDPDGMLKSFEAINKLLTQQKDWKQLERAFRKMLHRLAGKGDPSLEFNLWHNLGVIYRDRLKTLEAAAEAFTMASRLQPENMLEHQILAELYAVIPGKADEAIAHQQILLKNDPYRVDSYRALYKLYFDARQYDKAWCVAATLNFLKKADSEQRQFHEQYKPEGPIRPRNRLNNERWVKDLFHPEEDFLAGKVFEAVTPAVLRVRAQPDKKWSLTKKDLIPDVMNTTVAFARTYGFVTQVLSLPFVPRLFVCPDRQGGLAFATTQPPASVCGSALLSGQNPLDVIFIVAKHLAYFRGEHFIRTMFQTKDELKLVLVAAMHIAGVEITEPAVIDWAKQIRAQMQPADVELLNSITKRFVDAGARTDIKRWMQCVELTACRTGFLMCNDLEIASRMIQAEPPMGAADLTPKEKVQDLVLFSVSEQYFRLREALGIQVQVG